MKQRGRHRREILVEMCPQGRICVDVGADHGHVARSLGAFATERSPNRVVRLGEDPTRWIVADGLRPFRHVDVAIIAGMGASTIASILSSSPRPSVVVLHAQDDPALLRLWLADNGWRIEEERLAREAGRFAELIRAIPGEETARGHLLRYGPRLLSGDDPLLEEHLNALYDWHHTLAEHTRDVAPARSETLAQQARFLAEQLALRGWR